MRKYFAMILLCFIVGCEGSTINEPTSLNVKARELALVKIGNCEYIQMKTTHGYGVVTHKGDCNNPHHKDNQ